MNDNQKLVEILKNRQESVTTAESFTGGMLSSQIIDIAGASDVLDRAFVVYSDQAKHEILGVRKETLRDYTAVSQETCMEMLSCLRKKVDADLCLATTGYAGPGGEDQGHCFIGVLYGDEMEIYDHHFNGSRNEVRRQGCKVALAKAVELLKKENYG